MSSIFQKLKELEARYEIQENQKLDPLVKLKLTFPKGFKHKDDFLNEFSDFGFTFYQENYDNISYFSMELENSLASKLMRVINKKKTTEYERNVLDQTFEDAITEYNNNVTTYIDHNYNSPTDDKMLNYYTKSFEIEKNMLNSSFKSDFCNELVKVLDDCLNYNKLVPKFQTKDPLHSLVFEIYTTFEKLYHKNIINLHSLHYPYMYIFHGNDYRTLKNLTEKGYELNLEQTVRRSLNNKFDGLDSIVNNKNFKEMKDFSSSLDFNQATVDDHINSYLSKYNLDSRGQKLITALIGVIYKTVLEDLSIKQTKEVHDMFIKLNTPELISVGLKEYLSDRFDLHNEEVISNLISGSEPLYKEIKIKNKIKNSI